MFCLVGCLYQSPSSSDSKFIDEFESICNVLFFTNHYCILVEDFNIDWLISSFCSNKKNVIETCANVIYNIVLKETLYYKTKFPWFDYEVHNKI